MAVKNGCKMHSCTLQPSLIALITSLQSQAQAHKFTTYCYRLHITKCWTTIYRVIIPASTTIHLKWSCFRASWINYRLCKITSIPLVAHIPIGTPLVYISTHIIQSQFIGSFLSHRLCHSTTISWIPSNCLGSITTRENVPFALITATCSKLPFSLGWETEIHSSQPIKWVNKLLAHFPRHIIHRSLRVAWECTRVTTHDSSP